MGKYFLLFLCALSVPFVGEAASLTVVRDTITRSSPSATTTHFIHFTVTNAVPPSGRVRITPQTGAFSIPVDFGVEDVDVAYATTTGGPYTERPLGTSADATQDGVQVVPGSSGSIQVTLNSTTGLSAGDRVQVRLGTNAEHQATGDSLISNPALVGGYRMVIETHTAGGVPIDDARAMVFIVQPVSVLVAPPPIAPTRSNGLPSGSLAAGNSTIEVSLNTNELAHCRYATSSDVLYESMTGNFTQSLSTIHTKVISGHADGTSYTYFVRCADVQGTANEDDYPISFSLQPTPEVNESEEDQGNLPTNFIGSGGAGAFPSGSASLFLSSVTLTGWVTPGGTLVVLKDGKQEARTPVRDDGSFRYQLDKLDRGTYTIGVAMEDKSGIRSGVFSSTLTLGQGTANTISNIVVPPTVSASQVEIPVGEGVRLFGEAPLGSEVDVEVRLRGSSLLGDTRQYTASTTPAVVGQRAGAWEVSVPAGVLAQGTYEVRARARKDDSLQSVYGKTLFLGVGEAPPEDLSVRADLNTDGKINLVDFSILLAAWGSAQRGSDINDDGVVNLSDVSIMLFNWTG